MWALILRQLGTVILTTWLAITLAFFTLRLLPGNAIDAQLQGSGLPESVVLARKASLGFDEPLSLQYINYLGGLISGDWGQSLYTGQTVLEAISARLPNTLSLAGLSICLAISLGIFFGVFAGLPSRFAGFFRFIVDLSLGIPIYVTATILLLLVASRLGVSQRGLFLPVIALGFHSSGAIARIIETNLKNIQQATFIQAAKAKGLPSQHIIRQHMLKLALLPAIPVIALQAGVLFSGTVITETIFGRAGLGLLLLDATLQRDYPLVQGIVVIAAITYILLNQLAESLVYWLDPTLSQS